ncbi:hypothetical protein VpasPP24_7 [Vibrio phage Vpas_PP24]|nr:hypothetical protein VpasPP24_7 [Vibrio phage Vpas_PP24]
MTNTTTNVFSLIVFSQGEYKRVFSHANRNHIEDLSNTEYEEFFSRIVEHADNAEAAQAEVDKLNGVESKPTKKDVDVQALIKSVINKLHIDLERAKQLVNLESSKRLYVVALNDGYEALLTFDRNGKGNFAGTICNAHLATLADSRKIIEETTSNPSNQELLQGHELNRFRVKDICETIIAEVPSRIADLQVIADNPQ